MVAAVSHFDAYLVTHPFTIETDHKYLVFLNSAQHNNGRLARWAMRLQPFTFEVRYRRTRTRTPSPDCSWKYYHIPRLCHLDSSMVHPYFSLVICKDCTVLPVSFVRARALVFKSGPRPVMFSLHYPTTFNI